MKSQQRIRTRPQHHCILCGSRGESLYSAQKDRLFNIEGVWNLSKCYNRQCGLIWINPMLLTRDISKAYENYYTHSAPRTRTNKFGFLQLVYRWIKRGYLAGKFGYQISQRSTLIMCLGKLLYLFPVRRSDVDEEVRCIRSLPQGLLLDVGCGSGEWLHSMREFGWQVEGLDFDENAVEAAKLKGLRIHTGSLETQNFPDECFDVITLNHVIEHLPNPIATLVECRRILKKSGQLILYTPNSDSLGHWIFKEYWRGLEPPRHLHVFCPNSMMLLLRLSGFTDSYVRTVNSKYILEHSLKLWRGNAESSFSIKLATKVVIHALTLLEQSLLAIKNEVGECIVVQASNK